MTKRLEAAVGRRAALSVSLVGHEFSKTNHKLRGNACAPRALSSPRSIRRRTIRPWIVGEVNRVMDSIIYLVGLIVVVMFILGALGLH
jgi:hypothetical protein